MSILKLTRVNVLYELGLFFPRKKTFVEYSPFYLLNPKSITHITQVQLLDVTDKPFVTSIEQAGIWHIYVSEDIEYVKRQVEQLSSYDSPKQP